MGKVEIGIYLCVTADILTKVFVEPACGKARHSCYNFSSVYVRASVRQCVLASARICPDRNLYNNA